MWAIVVGVLAASSQTVVAGVALVWRFDIGAAVRSSPTFAGDLVVAGNGAGELIALDRASGVPRWRVRCGSAIPSRPAVAGDRVVVSARDGICAFSLKAGELLWKAPVEPQPPHPLGYDFWVASPLVVNSRVYVGTGAGEVRAHDVATGEVLWRRDLGARVRVTPVLAAGKLLVGAFDGRLYALDPKDGSEVWRFETEGVGLDPADTGFDRRSLQARPVVADETVYFGSRDGHFYAIDLPSGAERWRYDEKVSWVLGAALPFGRSVIVPTSDGQRVHALERATGAEVWSRQLTARALVDLALLGDDTVVVGETTGIVHGLDAATGEPRWRFFTDDQVLSSPACDGVQVAVGSDDGAVYLLEVGPGEARDARGVDRAVYFDEKLPFRWSDHDRAIRDRFAAAGYSVVAAAELPSLMTAHLEGKRRAVLVLATDVLPASVVLGGGDSAPLVRRFLESGGRVVSLGAPPGLFRIDLETAKPALASLAEVHDLVGVQVRTRFDDDSPAMVTNAGRRRGLWDLRVGGWGVEPGSVDEVLAVDEWGGAVAWIRRIGSGELIQLAGRNAPLGCFASALNLAEPTLAP